MKQEDTIWLMNFELRWNKLQSNIDKIKKEIIEDISGHLTKRNLKSGINKLNKRYGK